MATNNSTGKTAKDLTQSEYNRLRNQGYSQDDIRKMYGIKTSSQQQTTQQQKAKELTQQDYNRLRNQGYSQNDIREMYGIKTSRTRLTDSQYKMITDSLGQWGKDAQGVSDWYKKTGSYDNWSEKDAGIYADRFTRSGDVAKNYLDLLKKNGYKQGDQLYDAVAGYSDYFSGSVDSLNKNNEGYRQYRDAYMYQGADGSYLSYDQAKQREKEQQDRLAGMKDEWVSDYSTFGGHRESNYTPEEKKEAEQELAGLQEWLSGQDETRDFSDWYQMNLADGQNSEYAFNAAGRRLAVTDNNVELLKKQMPQREFYATDEWGNLDAVAEAKYNADYKAWNDKYTQALRDQARAQKDYSYAETMQFSTASGLASATDATTQSIIAKGKAIAEGEQTAADQEYESMMGILMPADITYVYMQQHDAKAKNRIQDTEGWSDEKKNTYYYLLGNGNDAAAERLAKITNEAFQKAKVYEEIYQPLEQFQTEHPGWGGVAATAAGTVIPLTMGLPEYLGMVEEYLATGEIDMNKPRLTQISQQMVGTTAGQINEWSGTTNESIPIVGGKGLGDVYQLGISILQSQLSMYTSMGMEGITLAQFFGSAASSGIMEGLEKGMDPGKALALGTLNGAAEAIGEVVSIDKLVQIKNSGTARSLLKDVFAQMGIEGSEEAFTTMMNTMADMLVNGDKNELQIAVQSYLSQGMSREDAEKQATKDWLNGLAFDFVGGAVSGGFGAGMATAAQNVGTYKGNVSYLSDLAQQTAEGSRSREIAAGIPENGRISAFRGNQFAAQVQQDLISNNTNTAVSAIEQRLTDLGETGDVNRKAQDIANAIIQDLSGEEAGGFSMRASDQISANATANMRTVMQELQQAREAGVDYGRQNERWTDSIMKGRFLDDSILQGGMEGIIPTLEYTAGRAQEKALNDRVTQMADLEQQIREGKKELGRLAPTDQAGRRAVNERIQEAETKLHDLQEQGLQDEYSSYTAEEKAASVNIDGKQMTVTGLTNENGTVQVKMSAEDGSSATVEIDDARLPKALRSLALKAKALDWAAAAAFKYYKPGTDINDYIRRIQIIRGFASETISRDAFMKTKTMQALNNAPLAEFLYGEGQRLAEARSTKANETARKLEKLQEAAAEKTGTGTVRTKGKGKVDITSGADIEGRHFEGIQGKKLSKTQNAVVKMVSSLANTLNIDYVIYDGETGGVQGMYLNGKVYLNINAGRTVNGTFRSLAAETLSHELTHFIEQFAPEEYEDLRSFVVNTMLKGDEDTFNRRVQQKMGGVSATSGDRYDAAVREVVADACTTMLQNSEAVTQLAKQNLTLAQKIQDFIAETVARIKDAFAESGEETYRAERKAMTDRLDELQGYWDAGIYAATINYNAAETMSIADINKAVEAGQAIPPAAEAQFSRAHDEEFMDKAEALNNENGKVDQDVMLSARQARKAIKDIMEDPAMAEALKLPADVMGKTLILNSSYGGSEENTTICVRSLAAQALMDEIAVRLGRPLTVQDTLVISQEIMNYVDKPECIYCYVATDRRAYRDFLYRYLEERDEVIKDLESGTDYETAYNKYLKGRKPTEAKKPGGKSGTKERFAMWSENAKNGTLIQRSDLASLEKLFAEIDELGREQNRTPEQEARFAQLRDAAAYAQSASWAKKMIGYTAYNGHILKFSQSRVNNFNKHYGLRMYSFSDFSPAFILENMQMITDAAVKGLKVLAYTKEIDFVKIFAGTGANINVSVFASEVNGQIMQDEMMGANWAEAIELRKQYPNVGITLVATNDRILEWGLNNPNVDVVIPYHLVRTGQAVVDFMNQAKKGGLPPYQNYTAVSADGKIKGVNYKGKQTSVYPSQHQNDLILYVDKLKQLNLTPRFASYLKGLDQYYAGEISEQEFRDMNPTYMKLVNETRQATKQSGLVQPVFNLDDAKESLNTLAKEGGYNRSFLSYLGSTEKSQTRALGRIEQSVRTAAEARGQYQTAEDVDALFEQYKSLTQQANDYQRQRLELERSDEYGELFDRVNQANGRDESKAALEAMKEWSSRTGYEDIAAKEKQARADANAANKAYYSALEQRDIEQEQKDIEKSGLSPEEYFRKKAVKEFGYTPYFYDAGYILPNGKMLNFSGEKGKHYGTRGQDHRGISTIYASSESGSAAMNRFMQDGNIRIMAESPGVDLATAIEPTAEQYAVIRKFVREFGMKNDYFNVDLTDASGRTVGNYEYDGNISPTKVIADIQYYFANGQMRDNTVSQFHGQFQRAERAVEDTEFELRVRENRMNELLAENEVLKESMEQLRKEAKRLGRELKQTKGPQQTRLFDAKKLASTFLKETGSSEDVNDIAKRIKEIGDAVSETANVADYDYLRSLAVGIARDIVSDASVALDEGTGTEDLRNDFKTAMKGRTIYVPEQYRADTGDWNNFRKRYFGIFKFSNSGTPVDQVYKELLQEMPGVLDASITNPGDMLNEMADKWDALQPVMGNPFEEFWDEAIESYTNRILQAALDGTLRTMAPTYADRMNARLDKERAAKWEKVEQIRTQMNSRLEQLRTEKNERIEEIRQQGIARKQETLARERAAKWEKVAKTRKYYQDMAERAAVRRKNTATRGQVRSLISALNTRLMHPTEKRYVPAPLVRDTIEILEMIDLSTERTGEKLQEKLAVLQQKYSAMKNDSTFTGYAYDPIMDEMIQNMARTVGNTPLNKMSMDQLGTVLDTLKSLEHIIRTAVTVKINGEERDAFEIAKGMTKETGSAKGTALNAFSKLGNKYVINTMRPEVVFEYFAGFTKNSQWSQVADMLNEAQRKGQDLQMEFAQIFDEVLQDKKALQKLTSAKVNDMVDVGLKDENGETVLITRDFMLALYLNLMNEDNARHIMRGGMQIPDFKEYLAGKGDRGYGVGSVRVHGISERLSEIDHAIAQTTDEEELEGLKQQRNDLLDEGNAFINELMMAIRDKMTEYDLKWVQAWWKFSELSTKVLNDTTMDVYGIKKATVQNYFPIITDKNFINAPMENIVRDMTLENAGFMKERVQASGPIKLMGLSDIVNLQASRTAQYAAIMPVTRAFGKIYNKTMPGYSTSVQDALNKKFGGDGKKFIENLMADLQGGRKADFTIFDRMRGRMAQATLSLNPRVALAQTASFPTAAAELGWKPVLKALARGGKKNWMFSAADRELIAKYSSALWFRSRGYTSVEMGDVKNMNQLQHKVMDKVGWAMNWINFMDTATVGRLWYAAQYYVDEQNPELKKGTDAYYEAVAEAFNRTVERTQPNYTTMQRPELLRNPHAIVRQMAMFMTQRLQNQSIVYGAAAKYLKYRSDLATGKNGITEADVKQAWIEARRAATSQVAAAATIVVFQYLCDALLHRMKKYRDEDEKLTAESVSLACLDNFANSLVSNMFLGSEIYSAIKSIVTKETYYGIELSGVTTLTDAVANVVKFAQKPSWPMAKKLGEALAQYLGIPAANAEKIGLAIWYHMQDAMNGEFLSFESDADRNNAQNAKLLTEAYMTSNKEKAEKYAAAFKDEDTMMDALRTYVRSGYVVKEGTAQTISKEQAVQILIDAGMRKKDAEEKVQEWTCELVTGIPFAKIKDEYMAGNITQARVSQLLQTYGLRDKESADRTARGYACEKATGHPYADLKEAYLNDEISKADLESALRTYGLMKQSEAHKKAVYYDFLKENPEADISEERAYAYMTTVKPTGISAREFTSMLYDVDADTNGSFSQDEVGKYLNAKHYNTAQNDALWETFGNNWKISFDTWQVKMNADLGGTGKGAGNGNVSQDELGAYLVQEINAGRMTMEEADKYWSALLTTSKKDFAAWLKKKRYRIG